MDLQSTDIYCTVNPEPIWMAPVSAMALTFDLSLLLQLLRKWRAPLGCGTGPPAPREPLRVQRFCHAVHQEKHLLNTFVSQKSWEFPNGLAQN